MMALVNCIRFIEINLESLVTMVVALFFAENRSATNRLVKWGFGNDNLCQCGEHQTAYHIVNDCKSIGPPRNLTDVDNPMLKQ